MIPSSLMQDLGHSRSEEEEGTGTGVEMSGLLPPLPIRGATLMQVNYQGFEKGL